MGFAIGRAQGRVRFVALFAVLLSIASAVPVLAESAPANQPEDVSLVSETEAEKLPSAAETAEAIAKAEELEAEEEELRETPAAQQEREESQLAYTDLSPAQAEDLLRSEFGEQLALIDQDPARALTEVELRRPLGPTGALVEVEGDPTLVDGTTPVRAPAEDDELRKVSLELEATAEGSFVTENGIVDLELPLDPAQPMQVGDRGLAIEPVLAAGESSAQRFGEKDLLYPEVLEAADLLATPISTGLELSALLRSQVSPEELRFALTLPSGAELRPDGEGGAQVLRDGQVLASVRPPSALDAQGAEVPVSMDVQGTELALSIKHRTMDVAYPLLLDPIVDEWYGSLSWYAGYNLQGLSDGSWGVTSNDYGRFKFETSPWYSSSFEGSNRGLFISYRGGTETQWAYRHGAWVYTVPGTTTYITDAGVSPFWRHNNGCSVGQYPKPHDYIGLWSEEWSQYGWITMQIDAAQAFQQAWTKAPSDWREKTAEQLHLGLAVGIYNTAPLPCNRDLYVGGAYVWMDDWEDPSIGSIGGIPSGWFTDSPPLSITAATSDPGLGVRRVKLLNDGKGIVDEDTVGGCTGLRANPCPANRNSLFDPTAASFGEGIRKGSVIVEDPLGKSTSGGVFTTMVDRSNPAVDLSGQLAAVTDEDEGEAKGDEKTETLQLPVYNLTIKATDIGNESDPELKKRSGVQDIEVWLDGAKKTVPWQPTPSCPQASCPKEGTYTLNLSTLQTAGIHKLLVKVFDFAGNEKVRDVEFEYFPATGLKDGYVMHHFPLPDGSGNEAEEEHPDRPELAVNVMNGNLVYREQDIEVDGTATVDLKVERYYNSMLPDSENTEWGDGWTLAETPDLEPIDTGGSPAPDEAELLESSGALEDGVALPAEAGAQKFDPTLQATLEKSLAGGYDLIDETGESATSVHFDETGQTEALLTEGAAKVDYSYEGGDLAEIEVIDPSTFAADPSELQIPKPQLVTSPTYASAFGANGSGDGQFKSPADVTVDSAGNLYVVDRINHRVQKFDSSGKFLSKFGTQGSGNGQFNQPAALAIDSAGNVWVADKGNSRVQKFNSKGEYLTKFGSLGTGNGQFASGGPEGLAVDSKGSVWVSDTYAGRIQKFNSSGTFVKAVSSKGSGLGQLGEPTGLDVAPDGKVWVADWQNNRVAVFNEAGEFAFQFGVQGSGNGAFSHPDEIEIDANGSVWVGDQGNNRVQQFSQGAAYVAQFGSYGSSEGKFSFAYPMGIAADSKGSLWVADVNNHRVQRWRVPIPKPTYASSFGSNGSGDGQLSTPADVAVDLQGNLWVADKGNNRIEKFDASGKFIAKYGTLGTGDGQFSKPSSVAVDRDGNILVADAENHRIQKFDPSGQFLSKFGTQGSADGQLNEPEEVLADAKGNIWVADTLNGRVQRFDEEGKFAQVIDSGQLYEPTGLDVDAAGNIWVSDWQKHRLSIFNPEGELKSSFGSEGAGNGQFKRPDSVEIDSKGDVWVGDVGNNRIQRFDLAGNYVGQFGSFGTGAGQFIFNFFNAAYYPMGIAADREGHLWIVDPYNHRVQQWLTANYAPAQAPQLDLGDGDARVEVETESGLVTTVAGTAAGEHSYEHEGDFLVSHDGPEGETTYEKDPTTGLLSKVTLPNGTWAEVKYFSDNRVKSVKVSLEGAAAKTTYFEYKDGPPRRTIVDPEDAPHVTYDIGEDGSVFRWWNTEKPPELKLAGTLYDNREEDGELWPGDHELEATAKSEEGINSINVLVNGTTLVDEKTCSQQPEVQGIECKEEENAWVSSTDLNAPGHLNVEVIATDSLEHTTSERFWVDIPEPPPPPAPGAPVPPRFHEIAKFREDYGLEIVFPVGTEAELNERIFDLIKAWHEPNTPLGAVARASWERWGIPLRPADVAELDYREWFYDVNAEKIDQWVEATSPGSYAGYYMDHPAGGVMHIGFLGDQAEQLANLEMSLSLVGGSRLSPYPTPPTTSYLAVRATAESVMGAIESNSTLANLVVSVEDDEAGKSTRVGTPNVAQVESILDQMLGANAPVAVEYEAGGGALLGGRYRNDGRMRAGDYINSDLYFFEGVPTGEPCTAGFGAEEIVDKPGTKDDVHRLFLLTAGHCTVKLEQEVWRNTYDGDHEFPFADAGKSEVGRVARSAFQWVDRPDGVRTDGTAIRIKQGGIVPLAKWGWDGHALPTEPPGRARKGNIVCYSGALSKNVSCGKIVARSLNHRVTGGNAAFGLAGYWVRFPEDRRPVKGDSGSPVWNRRTGASIGLVSFGRPLGSFEETLVAPLLHPPNMVANRVPGILHHHGMEPLQLKLGG